jgi:hypothetical protein
MIEWHDDWKGSQINLSQDKVGMIPCFVALKFVDVRFKLKLEVVDMTLSLSKESDLRFEFFLFMKACRKSSANGRSVTLIPPTFANQIRVFTKVVVLSCIFLQQGVNFIERQRARFHYFIFILFGLTPFGFCFGVWERFEIRVSFAFCFIAWLWMR